MSGTRRIFGIDPGTASTGFGVIDVVGGNLVPIWYDCLTTSPRDEAVDRLVRIVRACESVIERLHPTEMAIEDLYFGSGPRSALAVGQARGALMVACAKAGLVVNEYTPATIKQAITGYGRADKQQMQEMVKHHLSMTEVAKPDHAADALAVAITHARSLDVRALRAKERGPRVP